MKLTHFLIQQQIVGGERTIKLKSLATVWVRRTQIFFLKENMNISWLICLGCSQKDNSHGCYSSQGNILKESMNMPENRGSACTLTSQRKPILLPANKV